MQRPRRLVSGGKPHSPEKRMWDAPPQKRRGNASRARCTCTVVYVHRKVHRPRNVAANVASGHLSLLVEHVDGSRAEPLLLPCGVRQLLLHGAVLDLPLVPLGRLVGLMALTRRTRLVGADGTHDLAGLEFANVGDIVIGEGICGTDARLEEGSSRPVRDVRLRVVADAVLFVRAGRASGEEVNVAAGEGRAVESADDWNRVSIDVRDIDVRPAGRAALNQAALRVDVWAGADVDAASPASGKRDGGGGRNNRRPGGRQGGGRPQGGNKRR